MTFPVRCFNWIFLFISAILELVAIYYLIELLYSHCVRGGEYGLSVWFFIYFLPAIAAHTILFVFFRLFCRTVGLDPVAIVFNLTSGVILIIATLIELIAMSDHCGNEFGNLFYISGSCGLIAGIFHLGNGIMCLIFIPPEEARYIKSSRKSKKNLS
ncbi:uncharacterized protein [Drosophila virilis]|uniref:Uncharacterized protein, isoform A n=1 Tax=Drosophila virilis TaxID=7244 RepID=B4M605_DROVI|nr:uncharacterized protein LOC6633181 isoform X1 [Drosophila virilis]EDW59081.1 uncharacterized protein Dvir_GJ10676, isoform A [Drosophila virilis]